MNREKVSRTINADTEELVLRFNDERFFEKCLRRLEHDEDLDAQIFEY